MQITVNDEIIPAALFEQERDRLHMDPESPPYQELDEIVRRNLIGRALLRQASKEQAFDISDAEIDSALADLKDEAGSEDLFYQRYGITSDHEGLVREEIALTLQVERFMEGLAKEVSPPGEDEIAAYYEEHREELVVPEEVEASHILKNVCCEEEASQAYDDLRALRRQLREGADFSKAVSEHSDSGENEGQLGRFRKGQMVPEFEAIAFSMEVGEISPVFPTQYGFHVLTVTSRTDEKQQTLEEAHDEIRDRLHHEARNRAVEAWVAQAEKAASIVIEEDGEDEAGADSDADSDSDSDGDSDSDSDGDGEDQ